MADHVPDYLAQPSLSGHLYGELDYDEAKKKFVLSGEPAMREMARRLFPGCSVSRSRDTLLFDNTRRIVGDLNWFLLRFPLQVNCPEKLQEGRTQAIAHAVRREHNSNLAPIEQPKKFRGKLFPYQRSGAAFLVANERCILADQMGMGKTWTALAAAAQANKYPVLIVCQTQILRQWQHMVGALFPTPEGIVPSSLGVTRFQRAVERGKLLAPILRTRTPSPLANTPFAIIHYGLLTSWKDALLDHHFPTIIFDEVQELRRRESAKYTAASLLSSEADQVWGNSGTPVYGYGAEIWNVLNAIDFHCLGSYDAFTRDWCTAYGGVIVEQPAVLGNYLAREGLMLRRRVSEVLPELPKVSRRVQAVDHDEGLHAQLIGEAIIKASKFNEFVWHERGQAARDIDRLSRYAAGVAKAPYVAAFVAGLIEAGERPLLFGWHHDAHDIYQKALEAYQPAVLTGRETENQKDAALQRFMEGQTPLAILSLRTAAGLDGLQYRATCVVMGELDWSPAVHSQCLDAKTEILTNHGWRRPSNIKVDEDLSAGFDLKNGSVHWLPIEAKVDRPLAADEDMYAISSKIADLRVTGGHNMVARFRTGHVGKGRTAWQRIPAHTMIERTQMYEIPVAGVQEAPGMPLSDDEVRFLGWFVTDGTMGHASRQVSISQAEKSPYLDSLRRTLDGCNFKYGVYRRKEQTNYGGNSPLLVFYISRNGPKRPTGQRGWGDLAPYLNKSLNNLYEEMNVRQLKIFMEAVNMGNGAHRKGCTGYDISTGNRKFASHLQSLCVRRGWRTNLNTRPALPGGKPLYELRLKEVPTRTIGGAANHDRQSLLLSPSTPGERVWCVENALGTLIIRRNGKVAIVGNCEARIARLGIPKNISYMPSFYCISETGYDQVMLDVLGLKTEQFTGILLDEPETYEEKQKQELSVAQRITTLIEKLSGKKVVREMASREAAELAEKLGEENS